ncbi:MAG: DUF3579 domain-containing protein [Gammaproteobacteria bacterium]|nr:DUF3579 domain-containing protein [Gammaproteobacteria bacterium]
MPDKTTHLIVEGMTEDGRKFRPSDWAERLIDTATTYGTDRRSQHGIRNGAGDRRRRQLAFLQVQVIDGKKCLIVDIKLREANPAAYAFVMEFAETNRLCRRESGLP